MTESAEVERSLAIPARYVRGTRAFMRRHTAACAAARAFMRRYDAASAATRAFMGRYDAVSAATRAFMRQ